MTPTRNRSIRTAARLSTLVLFAVAATIGPAALTTAATLTFSTTTTLTPDANDASNLTGSATDAGNVNNGDDAATYVAGDRPAVGQTFTTGSNPLGYTITGVSYQHVGYSTFFDTFAGTYTVRVTDPSASGTGGFVLDSETYASSGSEANEFGSGFPANGTGRWVTLKFNSPITLAPNTTYGFDLASPGPFFETNGNVASATYAGGEAYSSGASGAGDNTLTGRTGDHAFISHLTANGTLAYWRFEGVAPGTQAPAGTVGYVYDQQTFADSSGNDNELEVFDNGGAGYAYRGNVPAAYTRTGAVNAGSIQNTGGFPATFTEPGSALNSLELAQWTVEASWKPENGGFRTVVGRDGQNLSGADTNLAALYLGAAPDNSVLIRYVDESGAVHLAQSAAGVVQGFDFGSDPNGNTGVWHNIVATSDGSTLSLYVDKTGVGKYVLVAQTALGGGNTALTDGFTSFGGTASGGGWTAGDWTVGRGLYAGGHTDRAFGLIDEVRISNVALAPSAFLFTQTQIPIVNGSFEQPIVDGGGIIAIPGWGQGADTGIIDDKTAANGVGPGNPPVAADGDQIAFLGNGTGFTNIWQDISNPLIGAPGAVAYTFTVALGIRTDFGETPGTNGTINIGIVDLTGVGAIEIAAIQRAWLSNEFKYFSVSLAADTLAPGDFIRIFIDKLDGNSLIVVDDAMLTVVFGVPTPAALPAGLAMLGLAAVRRRRR